MCREVWHYVQAHVRERAHRKRHAFGTQSRDELGIVETAHPVVDGRNFEQIERLPNILGAGLLAGMGYGEKALRARPIENRLEFRGWITAFGRVEPDADDSLLVGK